MPESDHGYRRVKPNAPYASGKSGALPSGLGQSGDMDRLERLVVHVEEGVHFGTMPDEAHLRLGLVLLDSAAELMMHRESEYLLNDAEWYSRTLKMAKAMYEATGKGADMIAEYQGKVVSSGQRKKIERDFNAKCDYLHQHDLLAAPQARILKKLHKYRNEIYHRDQLRPVTLASAAKIYIYLVCSMMRDFPVHVMSYSSPGRPSGLIKYLEDNDHGAGLLRVGLDLQARIATRLLHESGVAQPAQLGQALSQHVCDRLDELVDAAEECASFIRESGRDEGWDLEAVLGITQIDPKEYVNVLSSHDARALKVPIRAAQIQKWRTAGEALAKETDDMVAFAAFADLEDAFEPVEAKVIELAIEVDREIQLQVDIALGK